VTRSSCPENGSVHANHKTKSTTSFLHGGDENCSSFKQKTSSMIIFSEWNLPHETVQVSGFYGEHTCCPVAGCSVPKSYCAHGWAYFWGPSKTNTTHRTQVLKCPLFHAYMQVKVKVKLAMVKAKLFLCLTN
jgi:hypothetical protein